MEIQQLRCLIAVAEHGSFTKAAAAVHLTQPSLSHAVAKLEAEFRVKLFYRSARGVTLTPAGELLTKPARQALSALENIESTVASLHGVTAGVVRIVTSRTFATPIAEVISEFRERYPQVRLRISSPQSESDIYTSISSGEYDIAFARIDRTPPDFATQTLGVETLAALLPPGNEPYGNHTELTWAQVSRLPLILPPAGNQARMAIDRVFAAHGVSANAAVENEDYASTLDMVRAGVGACLTPATISRIPAGVRMKAIVPAQRTRIGLVHQPGQLAPAVVAFNALAVEHFRELRTTRATSER